MTGNDPAYYMRPGHVIAAAIALSVLAIVAVGLRFWARKIQRQPPKADDWLMVPATLVTVGIGIAQIYGVSQKGIAYRIEVPPGYTGSSLDLFTPQLTLKSQIEWAYLLMLPLALGCIKSSFLFFYMRVFAIQKHSAINKLLMGCIILVVSWTIAFFFATLFECGTNFWRIWNSETEFRRCADSLNLVLILCITDFVTDLFIIFIPVPLVLRLNLSRNRKISVCFMFLLGGVTVVVAIIRFIMMAGSFLGNFDMTSDDILGETACMYWGMVECGVGVFAACLPTIQFLFRKFLWEPAVSSTKSLFSSRSSDIQRDAILVDQTFDIAYAKVHNNIGRETSPAYLPSVTSDRSTRASYMAPRDDGIRAFA
ncbi:hypothetical protein F4804DRAFT_323640 [Jackrogersella minutella]|nr:hypothetical protein F4804DRAFT_323640 [Jackrogersella minutella]